MPMKIHTLWNFPRIRECPTLLPPVPMSDPNHRLATLLSGIANMLSARKENPYRIRAYRRAADSVLELQEDIGAVAERGELRTLSGIGKELAAKIEEFLSSGSIRTYEELKTPLPPEVHKWVNIPGFSEPLVQDLYCRLHITTLDDLDQLVRSHMLRTVLGGSYTTKEILDAIQDQRQREKGESV